MRSSHLSMLIALIGGICLLAACKKDQPPPRQAAPPAQGLEEPTLTTDQLEGVQQTVQSGMSALSSRCYQAELERRGESVSMTALLRILVGQQGRANKVELQDMSAPSAEFEQCVDTVVRRWDFPRLAQEAWFTYPLSFSPEY